VLRQIYCGDRFGIVEYVDIRKCNKCGIEYYSDFYVEVDGERHYSNKKFFKIMEEDKLKTEKNFPKEDL
jgi:hypothetical protein